MKSDEPLSALLNNLPFSTTQIETPVVDTVEQWNIINTTGDTHPIHLHLVQFQVLSRQKFRVESYLGRIMSISVTSLPDHTPSLPRTPFASARRSHQTRVSKAEGYGSGLTLGRSRVFSFPSEETQPQEFRSENRLRVIMCGTATFLSMKTTK